MTNPVKVVNETIGNNSVTVEYYEDTSDHYTYVIKAIFGHRCWAKYPHKTDPSYPSIPTARYAAMKALEDWCHKNSLTKAFNATINCFQPELFDNE